MKLLDFQQHAVREIVEKANLYRLSPNVSYGSIDPFIQFLQGITGCGKTPMLAAAVSELASQSTICPIILWTSKTSAVVGQTYRNLQDGGRYHHLISPCHVAMLADVGSTVIEDLSMPLIITSTVASYARQSKEGLKVFQGNTDATGSASLWESLKTRNERPLYIVYDESHNATDNQLDLLLELKPTAILLSSATTSLSPKMAVVARWDERDPETRTRLITQIKTSDPLDHHLIKSTVCIVNDDKSETVILSNMLSAYRETLDLAVLAGIDVHPKCIYVSETNLVDDQHKPFHERQARPIIIWRHLVEQERIDPDDIVIYCSLQGSDFPENFHLIKKYSDLTSNYRHIIFNLGLQEGWDDPEVCFAYIDKTLNSSTMITQIAGRVLRQPNITRHEVDQLNTAHFYVKCPTETLKAVLATVKQEIEGQWGPIRVIEGPTPKETKLLPPQQGAPTIPRLMLNADLDVKRELARILERMPDYRTPSDDTGHTFEPAIGTITIGKEHHLNRLKKVDAAQIRLYTILRDELRLLCPDVFDLLDPVIFTEPKFDAMVSYGSKAALCVKDIAKDLAQAYVDNLSIIPSPVEPYIIPPYKIRPDNGIAYVHAIHDKYDQLNPNEQKVASALDELGYPWIRNPSTNGSYNIPLPTIGAEPRRFFPDFVVFCGKTIWLIDPKNALVLTEALKNKLISPQHCADDITLRTLFLVEGHIDATQKDVAVISRDGVTAIWGKARTGVVSSEYFNDYHACLMAIVHIDR